MVSRISALLPLIFLSLSLFFCLDIFGPAAVHSANAAESRKQDIADRVAPEPQTTPDAGHDADRSLITARNLFGLPQREEAAANQPLVDLPATSLDLVLMGIVDGGSRDRRAVILSRKDKIQQLYQVGDMVAGAQIQSILWGKVILRTDGGDEVLDMSETASHRSRENIFPVVAPAPVASSVSPQGNIVASSDSWESDSRLIPERVRLVLPDQEGTEVEDGTQNEAQKDE